MDANGIGKNVRKSRMDHCHEKPPTLPEDSRSSTISGRVRVAVSNGKPIPLTPTLAHRGRPPRTVISPCALDPREATLTRPPATLSPVGEREGVRGFMGREQPAAGSVVREVRRADTALGCVERRRRIFPAHEPPPLPPFGHPLPL